jgi:hypothetical protein
MSIEERRRLRLYERWVDTWGREEAETMLDVLPPPGRDLATTQDIAALDARISALDTKIDTRVAALDAKIDKRVAALDAKIDTTATALRLQIEAATAQLTAVFRSEIQRAIVTQTRITIFSMVTAFAAVSALALGLA